ncbi:MAG: alpha/beta hydrolase [Acidimicrobiia bacterium]|nr:alpha/beta hydrolase [Acidimicrobiia bacterium]
MRTTVQGKQVLATTGGRDLDRDLPLLLFIHGAGHDRTAWQLQTRYFAHHGYAVVAVDLPGHGGSEGPPPDSIAGYADWVADFIESLGWDAANVVAHSMGSLIAIQLAASHPDQVISLALLGPAAAMMVHPDLLAAARSNDHLAYDLITGWSHSAGGQRGGNQTPGIWMSGATMRLLERNHPGVLANDLAACAAFDGAVDAAAEIRAPTLLLLGSADLMTRPAQAAPLQAKLNQQTIVLDGVGHSMMMENPDGVIDAVADFLRKLNEA